MTYVILDILEKTVDGYVVLEDFLYHPGFYVSGMREVPKSSFSQAIKRLKESGLIAQVNLKDNVILKLTDAAIDLQEGKFEDKNWDGKWRIVIFDIPEQKRLIRDLFRRNLKKWGFKHLQKSVWVSKRDIFDKLTSYVTDLGIEEWVGVFEAEKFSGHHNI